MPDIIPITYDEPQPALTGKETDRDRVWAAASYLRKASGILQDVIGKAPNPATADAARVHVRDLWEWAEKLDILGHRFN